MKQTPTLRMGSRRGQRGIALILVTVGAVALIGMAGLALDMGLAFIAKSRLQNALDAAALSGAKVLNDYGSTALASDAAQADFAVNMGAMTASATVEFSPTLAPFVAGADPRFVRVSVATLPLTLRLAQVLPGVGSTFDVSGSAIAGPAPLGTRICGALPVALCGTGTDTNCMDDGQCFGYAAGPEDELEVKGDNTSLSSGNYGLVELSCGTGASCIRKGMAGGEEVCFELGGTIRTEPGVKSGPTSQGLDTRFGIYAGPVTPAKYPPDVVTTHDPVIFHTEYANRLDGGPYDHPPPEGRPNRRVVALPVIDCTVPINGSQNVPLLGGACFFLTRPVRESDGAIFGQLIERCEANGSVAEDPDEDSPFYDIRLFRDFASNQS